MDLLVSSSFDFSVCVVTIHTSDTCNQFGTINGQVHLTTAITIINHAKNIKMALRRSDTKLTLLTILCVLGVCITLISSGCRVMTNDICRIRSMYRTDVSICLSIFV